MNKTILMGRLTKDPEVKYLQDENSTAMARYTLAVDRRYRKDGGMIVSVVRKLWQKKLKSWRVLNYQMQSIMTILKIRWTQCWTILWIK